MSEYHRPTHGLRLMFVVLVLVALSVLGCSCESGTTPADAGRDATLEPDGSPPGMDDAATGGDAASMDAALADAASSDATIPRDGQSCDPSAVTFPAGGMLEEGQLCDDVFACVGSEAEAEALRAVAPSFVCDAAAKGPCSGWNCVLRPSTLDAAELAEVCAVTQLVPRPAITCMIYL